VDLERHQPRRRPLTRAPASRFDGFRRHDHAGVEISLRARLRRSARRPMMCAAAPRAAAAPGSKRDRRCAAREAGYRFARIATAGGGSKRLSRMPRCGSEHPSCPDTRLSSTAQLSPTTSAFAAERTSRLFGGRSVRSAASARAVVSRGIALALDAAGALHVTAARSPPTHRHSRVCTTPGSAARARSTPRLSRPCSRREQHRCFAARASGPAPPAPQMAGDRGAVAKPAR
jgi:hypothetical protein